MTAHRLVVTAMLLPACFLVTPTVRAQPVPPTAEPEKLAAGLRSADRNVRYKASLALARIGKPALPVLIEALGDKSPDARVAAANAVRDMKAAGAAAVPALAENLRYSGDRELGYPPAVPSTYSGSPALQVRWAAIAALGHVGPAAIRAMPQLVEALRGEYESGMAPPTAEDKYSQRHWRAYEMRGSAAWVLQKLGPPAARAHPDVIPALAAALSDPQRMVRINAAAALAKMGGLARPALPAMLRALRHPDQHTRVAAALSFGALGAGARAYVPALVACHNGIQLDTLSRRRIRTVIARLSPRAPGLQADGVPRPARRWAGQGRTDFHLVVQPYQDSAVVIKPDVLVNAFVNARMGNAITYWADHTWYNTPPPTADELRKWGMGVFWYFFAEDIFNPKLQRDWGFATVDDYNRDMADRIIDTGRALGKQSAVWAVGHEQMDAADGWSLQADGSRRKPVFRTKDEGYDFYRRWITTGIHKRHWMEYGNTRSSKFFDGWNTGAGSTWEFLAAHKLDTSPVTMTSGGVSPVLAHASFDILPQIGMYWWECQIDGTSLQVGSAYTRGAARQYGKRWLLDASPWSTVHGGPGWGYLDGKWTGGATDETQMRSWTYGYLAGADAVIEESSGATHFRIDPYPHGPWDKPLITSTGRMAQKVARFCFESCRDRGQSYNPVAVLLEHKHGFEPRPHTNFRGTGPWAYMPMGEGEHSIEKFWYAAYPGHSVTFPRKPAPEDNPCAVEPQILTESTFGDCFDVLTDRASSTVLARYPRVMLLGGIAVHKPLLRVLRRYVEAGGELLLSAAHIGSDVAGDPLFGARFGGWRSVRDDASGDLVSVREVRPTTASVARTIGGGSPLLVVNRVGRGRVLVITARHYLTGETLGPPSRWLPSVSDVLRRWIAPVWPLAVQTTQGHAPQMLLNRLRDGWLVTVGNHWGQAWSGDIRLRLGGGTAASVRELWTGETSAPGATRGVAQFSGSVPPYAYRTYRVR